MTDDHRSDDSNHSIDEHATTTDAYSALDVWSAEREPSTVSGTMHVDLADKLNCTEMRPKVWTLSPGDEMSYHRQTDQEEFYYVLAGPGRMNIDGDRLDVPEGTAIRVPPVTARQVLNDGEGGADDHVWLIIGAPPVPDDGRSVAE